MKYLIIGDEGMWTSGAWLMQEFHDCDVRVFFKNGIEHLSGIVEHVKTLEDGLRWVGKQGYIVSEDEKDVSRLRRMGYKVYGGNRFIERLENDRLFQMQIAEKAGICIPEYVKVNSMQEAIAYVKKNPSRYVLKQMGHAPKTWNYVGRDDDGHDMLLQLDWMLTSPDAKEYGAVPFMLQKAISGIEFATGAWWQYNDWLRDANGDIIIEVNKEHKKEGNGDTGLTTGEMGTVMSIGVGNKKLFKEMLEPLTHILRKECSDVCINIDANCGIVEKNGKGKAYLYELTPREGYPASCIQQHLLPLPISDFMKYLIDGDSIPEAFDECSVEWGVVTVMGSGIFPKEGSNHEGSFKNQPVYIPQWKDKSYTNVVPLYLKYDKTQDIYRIADWYEYILAVCHSSSSIKSANAMCVHDMERIETRASKYRTDIGDKFEKEDLPNLVRLGYIDVEEDDEDAD